MTAKVVHEIAPLQVVMLTFWKGLPDVTGLGISPGRQSLANRFLGTLLGN